MYLNEFREKWTNLFALFHQIARISYFNNISDEYRDFELFRDNVLSDFGCLRIYTEWI